MPLDFSFPIPAAPPEKQKPVERLVKRILAAKAQAASANLSALERELDELVYALYAQTHAERDPVEERPGNEFSCDSILVAPSGLNM